MTRFIFIAGAVFSAAIAALVLWQHAHYLSGPGRTAIFLGFPLAALAFCLIALRLPRSVRGTLASIVLSAGTAVYAFEAYLTLQAHEAADPAAAPGADGRTKYQVVREMRAAGQPAYPAIFPAYLAQTGLDGRLHSPLRVHGREVLPLSGVPKVTTVLCSEAGPYVTYESDRFGFNNPDAVWNSARPFIAAVGDSFTQGVCVPREQNFVSLIGAGRAVALNLGMSGSGPLISLAIMREYLPARRPPIVLWFFFDGNDVPDDLAMEKRNPLLLRYLSGETQGLAENVGEIGRSLKDHVDGLIAAESGRRETDAGRLQATISFIGLARLRHSLNLASGPGHADYHLFRRILAEAQSTVGSWGGRLYFVYLPSFCTVTGQCATTAAREQAVSVRRQVRDIVEVLRLPLIDVLPALAEHRDPPSLFAWRHGGHYGPRGYRIVADTVLARLRADGVADLVSAPASSGAAAKPPFQ